MSPFQHILVATDFSKPSLRAVDFGLMLASRLNPELTLMHAYELPAYAYEAFICPSAAVLDGLLGAARQQLDELLAKVRVTAPHARAILGQGAPWQQILLAAHEVEADAIVVGTHGRAGIRRTLLGSVAERVLRLSPVPVLIVP